MSRVPERRDFVVGEVATLTRTISDADIRAFADLSGDDNPVHLDDEYAVASFFGGRIAHGMLVASFISNVLGAKLPGPGAVYLSQQLRFLAPVRPGNTIVVRVEVTSWDPEKGRITVATDVAKEDGEAVVSGEARLVMSSYLKNRL